MAAYAASKLHTNAVTRKAQEGRKMSKAECVRRARNLNHQAIAYCLSGEKRQRLIVADFFTRHDEFMARARAA